MNCDMSFVNNSAFVNMLGLFLLLMSVIKAWEIVFCRKSKKEKGETNGKS